MELVRKFNVLKTDGTYELRPVGALGTNISIGYDSSGAIITDDTAEATTKSASQALKDLVTLVNSKAVTNHRSTGTEFGVADTSYFGHVKVGDNITQSGGVISLTKANVTSALGYTPPTTNTTYNVVTTSVNGLMIASDKAKLDKIEEGANNYTLPIATNSVFGGVKAGDNITLTNGILSLTKANVTSALGYTPPTKDTIYTTGTSSTSGLTKLYTATGTNTDGTLTQAAIKTLVENLNSSISDIETEINNAASQLKDL